MDNHNLKKWQTTSSRYIVNDRWLRLRADRCVTPEGHVLDPYYVLENPDWVNCVVIDKDDGVLMVRHYRHAADEYLLELVSGMIDPTDSSPQAAIQRELREELGYSGGEIYQTGVSYANPPPTPTKSTLSWRSAAASNIRRSSRLARIL